VIGGSGVKPTGCPIPLSIGPKGDAAGLSSGAWLIGFSLGGGRSTEYISMSGGVLAGVSDSGSAPAYCAPPIVSELRKSLFCPFDLEGAGGVVIRPFLAHPA
jgi:hypothetical protein